ncbi:MAG: aminotransferase class I/II-fold pyridoxal phosphate-dependent enzyme [Myxococcota bacterium]
MSGTVDVAQYLPADGEALARRSLSAMALGIVGSEILKIAADVRKMVAEGRSVVNLTVGDFAPAEFRIPPGLEKGIRDALASGQTNYPPSDGVLELRKAVVDFVERQQGLRFPVESVLISGGARPLLYSAYRSILDPGETVVYPVPSWNNNHYCHVSSANGIAVKCSPERAFLPTPDDLLPYLPEARLLVLNSPLNPTGTAFGERALEEVARAVVDENRRREAAGARSLMVIYDQVYSCLTSDNAPHQDPVRLVPEMAPYVVLIDGISKAFAATGLRVGWCLGAPPVIARMRDLVGHMGAWAPRPEQLATAELLRDRPAVDAYLAEIRGGVSARLNALYEGLMALKAEGLPVDAIAPAGAIYLSAKLALHGRDGLRTNDDVRRWVLREAGTAVVPFQAFAYPEDDGWFRMSVGAVSVDACTQAMVRLGEALRRLPA